MKLANKHIDDIMKIHQQEGRPFASREEAADYLLALCKIFAWLLKYENHGKPHEHTADNSLD